jgi:hypothetical protein
MAESLGRAARSREIRPWRLLGEFRELGEEKTEYSAEGATRDWEPPWRGAGRSRIRDGAPASRDREPRAQGLKHRRPWERKLGELAAGAGPS